jgi:hypothetical protein
MGGRRGRGITSALWPSQLPDARGSQKASVAQHAAAFLGAKRDSGGSGTERCSEEQQRGVAAAAHSGADATAEWRCWAAAAMRQRWPKGAGASGWTRLGQGQGAGTGSALAQGRRRAQ